MKHYSSECIFAGGTLNRFQCRNCDVIFGPLKMLKLSSAQLTREYEWHYRAFTEGDSTAQEMRAFYALQPRKDGVYLNYGCGGWSTTLKRLRADGWNVLGYEPHSSATGDQHGGVIISTQERLKEVQFDGIFSNNVLEHLRYADDDLRFMSSLLKPDGRMAHATACYQYLYEYTRFHLFFYLGRSRDFLASKAGLTISEFIEDGHFMCAIFAASEDRATGIGTDLLPATP